MSFRDRLRPVRALRASGTPPELARPVIEAALQAAEAEPGTPARAERLAQARAHLPEAPWATHDLLEALVVAEQPAWRRALGWAPVGLLVALAVVAGARAVWVIANRPAWDEGLDASYHTAPDLRGRAYTRRDSTLDHAWGQGAPLPELPVDRFSVVWTGCLAAPGPRWLHAGADDGVRITLGDALLFERWGPNPFELHPAGELPAGVHPLRVEFAEIGGHARVSVQWSDRPNGPPVPIPAAALVPPGGNRRHPCP